MGYAFVRTNACHNGAAMQAALPIARQLADRLATKYERPIALNIPAWSGCANRIAWVIPGETLGGFFSSLAEVVTDEKFVALVKQMSEHVDGRLSRDGIFKELVTASTGKTGGRFTNLRTIYFRNRASMAAAMPVAQEICDYAATEHAVPLRLFVPVVSGPVSRAVMANSFDDLDARQSIEEKMMADEKFRPMLQRLVEHVDGSRTADELWRSL